ncbi:MAG TPA: GxxExxY protein, partial [Longimicrobiales bacterium]
MAGIIVYSAPRIYRGKRGKRGMDINFVTEKIIAAAIKVHTYLGPGLLESVYEKCLAIEVAKSGLSVVCQAPINIVYEGIQVGHGYYLDMLVDNRVIVELKVVDKLHPIHTAQLISYLRLSGLTVGLLLNFHAYNMSTGIKRVVLGYEGDLPRFCVF